MSLKNKQELSEEDLYTFPLQVSELKIGSYIIEDNIPCRITNIAYSHACKGGRRKALLQSINLFSNRKKEDVFVLSSFVDVPKQVQIQEYDLININDVGEVIVQQQNGEVREDLRLDQSQESLIDQIKAAVQNEKEVAIIVVSSMGKEFISSFKIVN